MADKELRKAVKQALREGANPDGFTPPLLDEYLAMEAEKKAPEKKAETKTAKTKRTGAVRTAKERAKAAEKKIAQTRAEGDDK
jgi:hypothetical protein